jgi:hypothetical protein
VSSPCVGRGNSHRFTLVPSRSRCDRTNPGSHRYFRLQKESPRLHQRRVVRVLHVGELTRCDGNCARFSASARLTAASAAPAEPVSTSDSSGTPSLSWRCRFHSSTKAVTTAGDTQEREDVPNASQSLPDYLRLEAEERTVAMMPSTTAEWPTSESNRRGWASRPASGARRSDS